MRSEFIAFARACIDTPFRHQGRVPGVGLDCVGLVVAAAREVSIPVIDNLTYPHNPSDAFLRHMLVDVNGLTPCAFDDDQVADLLLLRYTKRATHVAIRTDGGLVHATADIGKVVELEVARIDFTAAGVPVAGRYRFAWPS
jgi:cell wall-associated NlpC family hydrolase